ncbi:hypothetical protein E3P99_03142 [Wallemia hederae]|uniref:BSD domain-containing protein n=1 Tax=Wallemia hederae TaxID=1540922 RepID=A0A4T0FGR1_9BASI|nr:hypothetical protein E3P99_03142 [Wallemia hederae]
MRVKVLFKKQEGWLELGERAFTCGPLSVDYTRLNTLFASKAGSTPVRLKVDVNEPQQSLTFTFAHPTNALSEREAVKEKLTQAIAANRARTSNQIGKDVDSQQSRASPGLGLSKEDLEIRKKVLVKDPALAKLHRDLVISGVISENDFWQGRQQLLLLEHLSQSQKPGKPSTLVDPRPTSSQAGEFTITITPQLVHDIFQEYPIVQKAYVENVPNPLNESDFWIRYFHSHLFARHRASSRQDANEARNDPVFDQYLEDVDDGLEPRHLDRPVFDRLLDLGSTHYDHNEHGNALDITMQAGKVKAALPLMRRFNEHSQRLLDATIGDDVQSQQHHIPNYEQQITIDDLQSNTENEPVRLNMRHGEQYYTSNVILDADGKHIAAEDSERVWENIRSSLQEWDLVIRVEDIPDTSTSTKHIEEGLSTAARIAYNDIDTTQITSLPAMQAAISCHTASTEFLRLYWSSVLAHPVDTNKVERMVDFIRKTPEKVDSVVRAARSKSEADAVKQALQPVLNGVEKVLANEQARGT